MTYVVYESRVAFLSNKYLQNLSKAPFIVSRTAQTPH